MFYDTTCSLLLHPKPLGEQGKGWWVVAEGDPQLGKYLRKLYAYSTWHSSLLIRPAWQDHITIVRNEIVNIDDGAVERFFRKWSGQKVEVRILLTPETNGKYWWLSCYSEACKVLRRDLGLAGEPLVPLHLSFGHTGVNSDSKRSEKADESSEGA